jgi:hypothetical protein
VATLKEIRNAVKATIEDGISGIKCYDKIPENAKVLPAVIVQPEMADFDMAMGRGTDQYNFTLIVLVSYNHIETAQDNLDPYITGSGSKSIRQCIWANKTLGLDGDVNAHVNRMFDYGMRFTPDSVGGSFEQLGARLGLIVYTRGT